MTLDTHVTHTSHTLIPRGRKMMLAHTHTQTHTPMYLGLTSPTETDRGKQHEVSDDLNSRRAFKKIKANGNENKPSHGISWACWETRSVGLLTGQWPCLLLEGHSV